MRRSLLVIFCLPFLTTTAWVQTDDLKQYLQEHYANKTFIIRDFLSGTHLRYDSSGSASKKASAGDWTETGFLTVGSASIENNHLVLKAQRMVVLFIDKTFQLRPPWNSDKHLKIEIELSGTPSSQSVDAVLSKVFLNSQDSLVDLVPPYWRPCVSSGLAGKDAHCMFAPGILAIPGVFSAQGPQPKETPTVASADGISHGHDGTSPPRATYAPEPPFSAAARALNFRGAMSLGLVVNKDGRPTNIRILQPLGAGLDAQAVQAVQNWRFQPATKNGEPVAAEIAVGIDFHLN